MNEKHLPFLLLLPCLFLIFFFMVYPFVYSIGISLYAYTIYNPGPFVGAGNYVEALEHRVFRFSISQTVYWLTCSLIIEFLLGLGLALVLSRLVRVRRIVTSLLIVPMMMTPVVVGLVWRFMYYPELGVINQILEALGMNPVPWFAEPSNSIPALIVVEVWQYTPFMTLIFLAGLSTIPRELYDASAVDGASLWVTFRHVTLPCLMPVILVAVIFTLMRMFKAFDVIAVVTQGGPGYTTHLISYFIYKVAWHFSNIGLAAAMSWILAIVVLAIGISYVRRLRHYLEI